MKTLTIRLTAPLQAYGNEANFYRRTSWAAPSKSAVIGMIAAALGLRRDNQEVCELNDLLFAVRVEQHGQQGTDFQIIEYAKNSKSFDSKLSYRDYLQDAVFIAAVGSEDAALIDKIAAALKHPKFQLYLGRRSCPPAGCLQIEIFADQNPVQVLERLPWQASTWFQKKWRQPSYRAEISADAELLDAPVTYWQKDLVGSFSQKNRYHKLRSVAKEDLQVANPYYDKPEHDIMANL